VRTLGIHKEYTIVKKLKTDSLYRSFVSQGSLQITVANRPYFVGIVLSFLKLICFPPRLWRDTKMSLLFYILLNFQPVGQKYISKAEFWNNFSFSFEFIYGL